MGRVRLFLKKSKITKLFIFLTTALVFVAVAFSAYFILFQNKIYPNIKISGIDVSGLTIAEANSSLTQKVKVPESVRITTQSQTYTLLLKDIGFSYDINSSSERAFNYTRTGNVVYDIQKRLALITKDIDLGLNINVDEEKFSKFVSVISGQNSIEPVYPSITVSNGRVFVNSGTAGVEVNQERLKIQIRKNLAYGLTDDIDIPLTQIDNSLTPQESASLKLRAERLLNKTLITKFEYNTFEFKDVQLIKFIDPKSKYDKELINQEILKISTQIDRQPQNSKFSFENGKVVEFLPSKDGVKTDKESLAKLITDSLEVLDKQDLKILEIEIPVKKTAPEITNDKVNNLGIKELIGRGTSTYYGSIPSRVHNVSLATSRINGTLVAPGETFSFNQTLGDVSQFTGYQQAYIISGGKTILGDGGGVCQVSTTLFRGLLNAGFPIIERSAHAYRVGYYEQKSPPGLDATVYGPSPDLKFINDTGSHILIKAVADPKNYSLVVEIYGTSDGRVSTVSKPVISNVVAAPEDKYQDDPSLPAGVIKQIEHKVSGARVVFNYSVKRNGEEIYNKIFISNYRPWQAVYLRGTGPTQ